MNYIYFDLKYAEKIHDKIIEISGGRKGNHDIGLIDSVLDFIQSDMYYPKFEDKLTHLVYSVNKNHAFSDGNKRTSIALGAAFLELNGLNYLSRTFIEEMENIAVYVADNKISKELLHKIITSLIYELEYSESLKLEIYMAISNNGA